MKNDVRTIVLMMLVLFVACSVNAQQGAMPMSAAGMPNAKPAGIPQAQPVAAEVEGDEMPTAQEGDEEADPAEALPLAASVIPAQTKKPAMPSAVSPTKTISASTPGSTIPQATKSVSKKVLAPSISKAAAQAGSSMPGSVAPVQDEESGDVPSQKPVGFKQAAKEADEVPATLPNMQQSSKAAPMQAKTSRKRDAVLETIEKLERRLDGIHDKIKDTMRRFQSQMKDRYRKTGESYQKVLTKLGSLTRNAQESLKKEK